MVAGRLAATVERLVGTVGAVVAATELQGCMCCFPCILAEGGTDEVVPEAAQATAAGGAAATETAAGVAAAATSAEDTAAKAEEAAAEVLLRKGLLRWMGMRHLKHHEPEGFWQRGQAALIPAEEICILWVLGVKI